MFFFAFLAQSWRIFPALSVWKVWGSQSLFQSRQDCCLSERALSSVWYEQLCLASHLQNNIFIKHVYRTQSVCTSYKYNSLLISRLSCLFSSYDIGLMSSSSLLGCQLMECFFLILWEDKRQNLTPSYSSPAHFASTGAYACEEVVGFFESCCILFFFNGSFLSMQLTLDTQNAYVWGDSSLHKQTHLLRFSVDASRFVGWLIEWRRVWRWSRWWEWTIRRYERVWESRSTQQIATAGLQ